MGPQNFRLSFACLFLILFQNGCALLATVAPSSVVTSTVTGLGASEAIHTVRGGYYKILIIEPIHNLRSYGHVDFLPFGSAIGPGISPELLKIVNEKVSEKIRNSRFGKPGESTLIVKGEVININQGTLSCSILVKVQLLDKETDKSQGVANVEGKHEGFPGIDEAASGLADGVFELLEKHQEK